MIWIFLSLFFLFMACRSVYLGINSQAREKRNAEEGEWNQLTSKKSFIHAILFLFTAAVMYIGDLLLIFSILSITFFFMTFRYLYLAVNVKAREKVNQTGGSKSQLTTVKAFINAISFLFLALLMRSCH